ncbi:hypothetical protein [Histidinibacterium aquaticum]|uniref:hypothetical protein n=1 Tax=Histidinibacterium aquaticum TaxID=2613962 RepID=UPI00168B454C|nr:hypothetical protein [Histidinibacterium aquaticum]
MFNILSDSFNVATRTDASREALPKRAPISERKAGETETRRRLWSLRRAGWV